MHTINITSSSKKGLVKMLEEAIDIVKNGPTIGYYSAGEGRDTNLEMDFATKKKKTRR